MIYATGSTSVSIDVQVVDDSGLPVTGLAAATFPTLTYSLAGAHADVAFPALSDLALITTAWAAGGVKERGEGIYRVDVPDSIFTTFGIVTIRGEATGKRLILPKVEVVGAGGGAAPVVTPSAPGFTTGYIVTYDEQGVIEAGVTVTCFATAGDDLTGLGLDSTPRSEISDANGLVQFTNLILGATYKFRRGPRGPYTTVTIPLTAAATTALDTIIGSP